MSKLDERAKAIAARCRTVGSHEAHDVICELLARHKENKMTTGNPFPPKVGIDEEEMTPPDINVADVVAEAEAYKTSHYLDANKQYSVKLDRVLTDLLAAVKQLQDKLFVTEDQRDVAVLSEQEMAMTEGLIRDERDAANKRVAELEGCAEAAYREGLAQGGGVTGLRGDFAREAENRCWYNSEAFEALSPKQEGGE